MKTRSAVKTPPLAGEVVFDPSHTSQFATSSWGASTYKDGALYCRTIGTTRQEAEDRAIEIAKHANNFNALLEALKREERTRNKDIGFLGEMLRHLDKNNPSEVKIMLTDWLSELNERTKTIKAIEEVG